MRVNYKLETGPHFSHCTLFLQQVRDLLVEKNSKPQHTYKERNQMFKRYRKASQSPIPSWATNQQVLIIFFCAFRNKGEGAPAISDLVQRENNGTGYWIVNMSDSHFGRPQYVIYCSQLRATPSADCNISHIAVGLSNYLIHTSYELVSSIIPFLVPNCKEITKMSISRPTSLFYVTPWPDLASSRS